MRPRTASHLRHAGAVPATVIALLVAACTPAAVIGPSPVPGAIATAATGGRTPGASDTMVAESGSLTIDDLLAVAESLIPPGGLERGRTTSDGAVAIRWLTPEAMDDLRVHYERAAADGGLSTLVDATAGGVQSWVFGDGSRGVNVSIQVAPMPGEGHLVSVTVTPA